MDRNHGGYCVFVHDARRLLDVGTSQVILPRFLTGTMVQDLSSEGGANLTSYDVHELIVW